MDLKNLTDSKLASIMVNYITRVDNLYQLIGEYLYGENRGGINREEIQICYRTLKNELREDANYLDKISNRKGSDLYMYKFSISIREAAAWGFTVPVNSAVSQKMLSAVEEARYKLTKYYDLEQWGQLS